MRIIRLLLAIFSLIALTSAAPAIAPVAGVNYFTLSPAQPTIAGKKVEVIEFFAYYCPHCDALDQSLTEWVKAQGDNIEFKRVHTTRQAENLAMPQQRLFYTLQMMGKEEEFHQKIMFAIHFQHLPLETEQQIVEFMSKQGVDRKKFVEYYHSFTVDTMVKRAIQMQLNYQIDAWPTIIIDGRFITSPPILGTQMETYDESLAQDLMLNVMNGLVAQQQKERNQSGANSKTK